MKNYWLNNGLKSPKDVHNFIYKKVKKYWSQMGVLDNKIYQHCIQSALKDRRHSHTHEFEYYSFIPQGPVILLPRNCIFVVGVWSDEPGRAEWGWYGNNKIKLKKTPHGGYTIEYIQKINLWETVFGIIEDSTN